MHKVVLSLIATLISLTAAAESEMMDYVINVEDFTELRVADAINVVYKCDADSAGKAVFTTTPDLASVMMFTNRKGKLVVQTATDGVTYNGLPTVTVYSNFLTSIENCGDSTVRVMVAAPAPEFRARVIGNGYLIAHDINTTKLKAQVITGNGEITLYGSCTDAFYKITGTGSIEADQMLANNVRCSITGTGIVDCFVAGELKTKGLGTGKVYYKGTPSVIKTSFGGVKALPYTDSED